MAKNFLSVGECMVEMAPVAKRDQFRMSYAGDTLNTAWYLNRLKPDWSVDYLTAIGQDSASVKMADFMRSQGLGTNALIEVPGRTVGLYMIELADGERSFSYWRSQSAARLLAADRQALDASFAGRDTIYFSGITLAILEGEGRANLGSALATAKWNGAKIVFDPNLRPKLWPNTDVMCAEIMKAAAVSDVVLPSHDDEAEFFGDASPQATIDRYIAAGATTVIGKNGDGEIQYSHEGVSGVIHPEPICDIVDTTAAGDSFNAGFLAGFDGGDVEAAIRSGCELAGKVICGRGALVEI